MEAACGDWSRVYVWYHLNLLNMLLALGLGGCLLTAILVVNMKREYIIKGKTSGSGKAGSQSDYWV